MIAVTTLLSGCSFGTIEEQKTGDVTYEIVKKEEIPEQLKEEIKEAGKKEMWISYADTGKEETYLYVVRDVEINISNSCSQFFRGADIFCRLVSAN